MTGLGLIARFSPEVIFVLEAIDWLKYLVAMFFFSLGLFSGWWQWRYRPLVKQLRGLPSARAADAVEKSDQGQGEATEKVVLARGSPASENELRPAPVAEVERPKPVTVPQEGDDLRLIRGIGPALKSSLNQSGIIHFGQIASWDATEIAEISKNLKLGQQIEKFGWIEQAKALEKSD